MRRPSATQLLLWAPVAFAVADFAVLLVQAPALVRELHHNADVAAAEVIGALWDDRGSGSVVTLGSHPWYESLWFMRATAWLPAEREIWIVAPFLFACAAIAALSGTAWRLFGPWVGAMVAVVLVCSSSAMRIVMFTMNWHGATLVHAVFLCVVLVALTRRADRLSPRTLVLAGVPVAAFTALIVSDYLSLATAIGPFVGAALLLWWRTGAQAQRRIAVFAVATMAVAVAGGELAVHAMESAGVIGIPDFQILFTGYDRLGKNLEIFAVAFTALGGGTFFGQEIGPSSLAKLVLGALTLGSAVLVVRRLWGAAPRLVDRATATDADAMAREAYVVFWSLVLVLVVSAFLITDVSYDTFSSRYLAGAFVALAALVPVLLSVDPRARLLVAAGIAAYAAITLGYHVKDGVGTFGPRGDLSRPAQQLADYAEANGLEFGYAAFEVAPSVTWFAHERVKVFALARCRERLCEYGGNKISTWYRPRPGTRTFLVTRPETGGRSLTRAYEPAGDPIAIRRFGPLTVYVYDHDLAADLG